MQIGEQVHYHLNAAARECAEADNGKAVLARVLGVSAAGFHVTIEAPEPFAKAGVQAGDGPGCISPVKAETETETAESRRRSEVLDAELGQGPTSDDTDEDDEPAGGGRR
jgi:hypothetical protein